MSRDWRLYAEEMITAAERAMRFKGAVSRAEFVDGAMAFEAVVRQIEIFGEAANKIPDEVRAQLPTLPWKDIVDMRNRLIHGYFSVDPDIVWNVADEKMPQALPLLKSLLQDS